MEVEYDMTAEDVLAFQRYHRAHPFKRDRRASGFAIEDLLLPGVTLVVALGLIWGGAVLMGLSFLQIEYLLLLYLGVSLLTSFVTTTYIRLKTRTVMRRMLLQRQSETDRQRLVLTPEGVVHSSPRGHGVNYWSAIKRLSVYGQHFFIYISSVSAYTVPRRAFVDDASFWAFAEAAQRYHDDAHAAPGGERWRSAAAAAPAAPTEPPLDALPAAEYYEKPEGLSGKGAAPGAEPPGGPAAERPESA
jgi:hypothetical protein